MKFVLLVEGPTEFEVVPSLLQRWLDPQLKQAVGIDPVKFGGWSDLVNEAARETRSRLNGPGKEQIIAVIALLDLYGPNIYPSDKTTAATRRKWAIGEIERRIGDPRFRMFFAVHEVEAWLLAQPAVLPAAVREHLPKSVTRPETVNFKKPPARLLNGLYLRHLGQGYRKRTDGKKLFPRLDPRVVYNACPAFAEMLDTLLNLARQAGL